MTGISDIATDLSPDSSADGYCRLAVEACPTAMVVSDSAGRIVLVNAAVESLFGYSRDELIGQMVEVLVPPRRRNEHLQRRASFARRPEPRRLGGNRNLIGQHRDGGEFPIEIGLYPIHTDYGMRVLSVIVDVGERVRTDRLKDEFVSTVSHELRTPLTSIAGSLGLLMGGAAGALPEPVARLIRIALTNSQRLVRLINDILDIEKIESGQLAFRFKRSNALSLVEQAVEAARGYADGFRVNVRIDADAGDAELYADPDRLAQVVTNLLSNAIKFSPSDGEVVVTIKEFAETVRIAVRDRGRGIPAEFRPRVFDRFSQAEAGDARQKGGTGLGLSIVKQIVTRLNGTVGFDDAAGGGTVFHVDLPSWACVAAGEIDVNGNASAPRVLLCEDNLEIASALREGLRTAGFSTDFAHSPADGIAGAKTAQYAALVVDIDLPDGDGLGLVGSLRAEVAISKTPIVVICGENSPDGSSLDALKVTECMRKPVDADRLAEILVRVVMRNGDARPRILHVDDDQDVLDIVAGSLAPTACIVSVPSIEEARRALHARHFDLAILDISVGDVSGLDLLPDLRSKKGTPIPVIVFSAHSADVKGNLQVLNKSSAAALSDLVAAVHDRLMLKTAPAQKEAV